MTQLNSIGRHNNNPPILNQLYNENIVNSKTFFQLMSKGFIKMKLGSYLEVQANITLQKNKVMSLI